MTTETVRAANIANALEDVANVVTDGNVLRFQIPNGAMVLPFYLKQLTTADAEPIGAEIARPTLDDVFLTPDRPQSARLASFQKQAVVAGLGANTKDQRI